MGKLEIRDLNQSFRERTTAADLVVLDNITFDVRDKEFVCILGSSGCGKTTLLRLIAGLDAAQAGSIFLDGEEIRGTSPKVGMVFQEYSLFPWRTVIDNIAFGLEMQGMAKDERYRIADRYLSLVNLIAVPGQFPFRTLGRDAAAGCGGAGPCARPGPAPDGRAVRGARCPDAEHAPEGTPGDLGKRRRRRSSSSPTVWMRQSTSLTGLSS